ncbi:MAG TPA: crosslink repair DNA glycosylase YcaQ family protein [Anaerolineae bacterium]|nr:crosslink repair DNA glycosylase YcaQ family protein [Anaerolineae bacterium]
MISNLLEKARWYSFRCQHLNQNSEDILHTLHHVIGIHSEHPTAPLSLLARTKNFAAKKFFDLEDQHQILRLPAMRDHTHIFPNDTAHLPFTATEQFTKLPEYRHLLHNKLITPEIYEQFKTRILDLTQKPISTHDLRLALDDPQAHIGTIVTTMFREGLLLQVVPHSLRANTFRYVNTESWLGHPLPTTTTQAALQWLATAYIHSYGPVRIADFQWWAGISLERATQAFATIDTISLHDPDLTDIYYLLPDAEETFYNISPLPADTITLLPHNDCYLLGYPPDTPSRFVTPTVQKKLYDHRDQSHGAILVAGLVVASWSIRFTSGYHANVTITPFTPLPDYIQKTLVVRFSQLAKFLGADTTSTEYQPI